MRISFDRRVYRTASRVIAATSILAAILILMFAPPAPGQPLASDVRARAERGYGVMGDSSVRAMIKKSMQPMAGKQ